MEKMAKSKGLSLSDNEEAYNEQILSENLAENRKKKIANSAINTIQKKYFIKFTELKATLENAVNHYNQFGSNFVPNKDIDLSHNKSELSVIDANSHPIMVELNKTIEGLKDSMPVITSKLNWEGTDKFKPRATSTNSHSQIRRNKAMFSRNVESLDSAYKNEEIDYSKKSRSVSNLTISGTKKTNKRYLDSSVGQNKLDYKPNVSLGVNSKTLLKKDHSSITIESSKDFGNKSFKGTK